ncbi:MAG: MucR family transcriptional regulator [Aestuariivirga sp.]
MEEDVEAKSEVTGLTAQIVSAYVGNNTVQQTDLPRLIGDVFRALSGAGSGEFSGARIDLKPAVPIKKSIANDYIVCLEDGKKFKSLKRHLRTSYNLSPEKYREKWGLPADYPMVAPSYAKTRSSLAKKMGLGRKRSRR